MCGNIECVQAPRVAHGCSQCQGFAACACAKIHHDFVALGIQQQGEQLRAFVLHFHMPLPKQIQLADMRLALQADTPRGVRRGCCRNGVLLQRLEHGLAFAVQHIDAQIQWCGLQQCRCCCVKLRAQLRLQVFGQPGREVVCGRSISHGLFAMGQPLGFGGRQGGQQGIVIAGKGQNGQAALQRAAAALRPCLKLELAAQNGVNGFGDKGAVAWPQRALVAKIVGNHLICGVVKTEQLRRKRCAVV